MGKYKLKFELRNKDGSKIPFRRIAVLFLYSAAITAVFVLTVLRMIRVLCR